MHKEILLAKKILNDVKRYSPIHKISLIEISIPLAYNFDRAKLKKIFHTIGINLRVVKGEKLKIISFEERY